MIAVFVVLPFAVVGVALPSDPTRKLGQALAQSVSDSLKTMKALENRGQGDEASFRQGMMETIMSKQSVVTNPEVAKVIEHANSVAEHQTLPMDATCIRDWSRRCPDGWEETGAAACLAPPTYKGGCKSIQQFDEVADQYAKFHFAAACSAPWACAGSDECPDGVDYETCPVGWESVGRGFCSPASSPSSKCASGVINFGDLGVGEKQALAQECGFTWACRAACERDYSARCPEGWQSEQNLCVAPATYAGDCSYSVDTSDLTEGQKEAWASRCSVRWQCAVPGSDDIIAKPGARVQKVEDGPVHQSMEGGTNPTLEIGLPTDWFKLPSGPIDGDGGIRFDTRAK